MKWFINFLTSSIGRKLIMSLTGLFLITFLVVHLVGNLQLLYDDGGKAFNTYAAFMTTNPLIQFTSIGLYGFIILHTIQGFMLWFVNKSKKGVKYAVKTKDNSSWASNNMALLGSLILFFILIHMGDFWLKMKLGRLDMISYDGGAEVKDLYTRVHLAFNELWIVIAYLIGLVALAFHLSHGFSSAFQTLGLRHKKYTPLINGLGWAYSILIPLAFAFIPLYIYFKN